MAEAGENCEARPVDLFRAVMEGASVRACARQFGVTRNCAGKRFRHVACALLSIVGVVGVDEAEEPTVEMVRAHRAAFEEALAHYQPERALLPARARIVANREQLTHLLEQTALRSRCKLRDTALLLVLFGTAARPGEIARLEVRDYLDADGSVREESLLPAHAAYNCRPRALYFASPALRNAIDNYLDERRALGFGTSGQPHYGGLDPRSRLFLTRDGHDLPLRPNVQARGAELGCPAILDIYRKLFRYTGINGMSALGARRRAARRLHQAGLSFLEIGNVLGIADERSVRKLVAPPERPSVRELMGAMV